MAENKPNLDKFQYTKGRIGSGKHFKTDGDNYLIRETVLSDDIINLIDTIYGGKSSEVIDALYNNPSKVGQQVKQVARNYLGVDLDLDRNISMPERPATEEERKEIYSILQSRGIQIGKELGKESYEEKGVDTKEGLSGFARGTYYGVRSLADFATGNTPSAERLYNQGMSMGYESGRTENMDTGEYVLDTAIKSLPLLGMVAISGGMSVLSKAGTAGGGLGTITKGGNLANFAKWANIGSAFARQFQDPTEGAASKIAKGLASGAAAWSAMRTPEMLTAGSGTIKRLLVDNMVDAAIEQARSLVMTGKLADEKNTISAFVQNNLFLGMQEAMNAGLMTRQKISNARVKKLTEKYINGDIELSTLKDGVNKLLVDTQIMLNNPNMSKNVKKSAMEGVVKTLEHRAIQNGEEGEFSKTYTKMLNNAIDSIEKQGLKNKLGKAAEELGLREKNMGIPEQKMIKEFEDSAIKANFEKMLSQSEEYKMLQDTLKIEKNDPERTEVIREQLRNGKNPKLAKTIESLLYKLNQGGYVKQDAMNAILRGVDNKHIQNIIQDFMENNAMKLNKDPEYAYKLPQQAKNTYDSLEIKYADRATSRGFYSKNEPINYELNEFKHDGKTYNEQTLKNDVAEDFKKTNQDVREVNNGEILFDPKNSEGVGEAVKLIANDIKVEDGKADIDGEVKTVTNKLKEEVGAKNIVNNRGMIKHKVDSGIESPAKKEIAIKALNNLGLKIEKTQDGKQETIETESEKIQNEIEDKLSEEISEAVFSGKQQSMKTTEDFLNKQGIYLDDTVGEETSHKIESNQETVYKVSPETKRVILDNMKEKLSGEKTFSFLEKSLKNSQVKIKTPDGEKSIWEYLEANDFDLAKIYETNRSNYETIASQLKYDIYKAFGIERYSPDIVIRGDVFDRLSNYEKPKGRLSDRDKVQLVTKGYLNQIEKNNRIFRYGNRVCLSEPGLTMDTSRFYGMVVRDIYEKLSENDLLPGDLNKILEENKAGLPEDFVKGALEELKSRKATVGNFQKGKFLFDVGHYSIFFFALADIASGIKSISDNFGVFLTAEDAFSKKGSPVKGYIFSGDIEKDAEYAVKIFEDQVENFAKEQAKAYGLSEDQQGSLKEMILSFYKHRAKTLKTPSGKTMEYEHYILRTLPRMHFAVEKNSPLGGTAISDVLYERFIRSMYPDTKLMANVGTHMLKIMAPEGRTAPDFDSLFHELGHLVFNEVVRQGGKKKMMTTFAQLLKEVAKTNPSVIKRYIQLWGDSLKFEGKPISEIMNDLFLGKMEPERATKFIQDAVSGEIWADLHALIFKLTAKGELKSNPFTKTMKWYLDELPHMARTLELERGEIEKLNTTIKDIYQEIADNFMNSNVSSALGFDKFYEDERMPIRFITDLGDVPEYRRDKQYQKEIQAMGKELTDYYKENPAEVLTFGDILKGINDETPGKKSIKIPSDMPEKMQEAFKKHTQAQIKYKKDHNAIYDIFGKDDKILPAFSKRNPIDYEQAMNYDTQTRRSMIKGTLGVLKKSTKGIYDVASKLVRRYIQQPAWNDAKAIKLVHDIFRRTKNQANRFTSQIGKMIQKPFQDAGILEKSLIDNSLKIFMKKANNKKKKLMDYLVWKSDKEGVMLSDEELDNMEVTFEQMRDDGYYFESKERIKIKKIFQETDSLKVTDDIKEAYKAYKKAIDYSRDYFNYQTARLYARMAVEFIRNRAGIKFKEIDNQKLREKVAQIILNNKNSPKKTNQLIKSEIAKTFKPKLSDDKVLSLLENTNEFVSGLVKRYGDIALPEDVEFFMPRYRKGRYRVIGKDPNENTTYTKAFGSVEDAEKHLYELQQMQGENQQIKYQVIDAKKGTRKLGDIMDFINYHKQMSKYLQRALSDIIKGESDEPPAIILQKAEREAYDKMFTRGFSTHLKKRKGTPGYDADNVVAFLGKYVNSLSGHIANKHRMNELFDKLILDPEGKQALQELEETDIEYLNMYLEEILKPRGENTVDKVHAVTNTIIFTKYLTMNLANAFMQEMQALINSPIALATNLGISRGYAVKEAIRAQKDLWKFVKASVSNKALKTEKLFKNLSKDELDAIDTAIEEGILDPQFTRYISRVDDTETLGKVGQYLAHVARLAGIPTEAMDSLARATSFLAGYRLLKRQLSREGMSLEEMQPHLKKFAQGSSEEANFIFGKRGEMPIAWGEGGRIFRFGTIFTNFSMNQLQFYWKYMIKPIITGSDLRKQSPYLADISDELAKYYEQRNERWEAMKNLIFAINGIALTAGVSAIPFGSDVAAVGEFLSGDNWEDEARHQLMNDTNNAVFNFISKLSRSGVLGMVGIDVSGSARYNTSSIYTPFDDDAVLFSTVKQFKRGIKDALNGDFEKAWANLPLPFTYKLKDAITGYKEGIKYRRQHLYAIDPNTFEITPVKYNLPQAIMRLFGFRTVKYRDLTSLIRLDNFYENKLRKRKQELREKIENGDYNYRKGLTEEYREINKILKQVQKYDVTFSSDGKKYIRDIRKK